MPNDAQMWARLCRTQAAVTTDRKARELLIELAVEYEAVARKNALDPDDPALQNEVAKRLVEAAARLRAGGEL